MTRHVPELERERSALTRYYGVPTILGGRGLKSAWQRFFWAVITVVVLLAGVFLLAEVWTRLT
jgi:hypothetical protein